MFSFIHFFHQQILIRLSDDKNIKDKNYSNHFQWKFFELFFLKNDFDFAKFASFFKTLTYSLIQKKTAH